MSGSVWNVDPGELQQADDIARAGQDQADQQYETSLKLTDALGKKHRVIKEQQAIDNPDEDMVLASRTLYEMRQGKEYEGTDSDLIRYGIDEMGRFNHSIFQADNNFLQDLSYKYNPLDMSTKDYMSNQDEIGLYGYMELMESDQTTPDQKLAFLHLSNAYTAMDMDNVNEAARMGQAMVADPSSLGGIAALASQGLRYLGKKGLKSQMRNRLETSLALSLEGAAFGDAYTRIHQQAIINASDNPYFSQQTEQDNTLNALSAGIGATFGALLPVAPGWIWDGLGWAVDKTYKPGQLGSGVGPTDWPDKPDYTPDIATGGPDVPALGDPGMPSVGPDPQLNDAAITPDAGVSQALAVPLDNAKGHAMPPLLLVSGTGEKPSIPIVQTFTPNNTASLMANIDTVLADNPLSLASEENWLSTEAQAFGGDFLPAPPSQAIKYTQDPQALATKLKQLSPEMKAAVDEGFEYVNEIKSIYNTGQASQDMTARLFTWGILSRGAGPMQQEGAFLDILEGATPFIKKTINGTFTESDLEAWKKMTSTSLPEGSPGKQVTMNANATGNLLMQLSKVSDVEGTRTTALKQLHDLLADPNASGPQVRRKFFELTNKAGIDNKVVSFLSLVGGKDDLLVMDRIQSRHLWDDGRYDGKNIYDGIDKGGLSNIVAGPRGLMITEMLENGLADTVKEAYRLLGRPKDASLSRMHWESWLIEGNQPVSHSTLESVRSGNAIGGSVTEGKPGTFSSGVTYRQTVNGSIQEYPLSNGGIVRMTPERQKEFEKFIKNPKNGIVPAGFKVTASKEGPWFTSPEVNRSKLDEAAKQFENANADGSLQSGTVRTVSGGNTISGRKSEFLSSFRADQDRAFKAGRGTSTNSGRSNGSTFGPYRSGSIGGDGSNGLLTFEAEPSILTQYQSAGLNLPTISQVDAPSNAITYNLDMTAAMAGNKFGPQVEIKSAEDLASSSLFRTESGSGFAIKPDGDIVAVFASSTEPAGGSYAMLQAAVQAGGNKLDAFDTVLPDIYKRVGFRPVARIPWNDEFAPPGWDKEGVFKKYNNGEPDIIFFVYDSEYFGGATDVPLVTDYDDAVRLQNEALK